LPSMTDDIANSIVFWVDPKATPRSSGADATYYAGLTPTYAPKNGPLDSIEELLLVKGVTPLLLYGYDKNRNGVIDPDETQTGGDPNNVGWAPYLTIYSRELNVDSTGNKRIYVNDTNLQTLQTSLAAVDADLATFIILCRLHAPTAIPATGLPKNISLSPANSVNTGDLNLGTAKAANTIASLYDLIDVYVTIPPPDPKAKDAKSTYVASPLMTTSIRSTRSYSSGAGGSQLADLLPKLLDKMTVKKDQQLYGRINLNTASQTVLTALANAGTITQTTGTGTNQKVTSTSLLSEADVTTILNTRPPLISTTPPEEVYQSPAWLITQAKLKVSTVKALEKYITTRSQVYRFQVIGYLDGGGPITRLDVAIDTNNGNPRVVHYRDLSELGKGFDIPQNNGQ
ncbi:MAG TPA: hypothetical protein VEL76_41665, partial [Gemmataceae bacterium]|nr:hypothetical protein [Gemmataceae bacterium]